MAELPVMKGQVALVCGLVIAGVPYEKACRVALVGRERMRSYVPASYRQTPMTPLPVPVRKMTDEQRRLYIKMRTAGAWRDDAFAEVMRTS